MNADLKLKATQRLQEMSPVSFDTNFAFSGGYTNRDGKVIPVDHTQVRVWLDFMKNVNFTKTGNAYGFVKLVDLIDLADALPKIVENLLTEVVEAK